jgi:DMSO/TMAO reductase YedYZ heme-binding membrane subunit
MGKSSTSDWPRPWGPPGLASRGSRAAPTIRLGGKNWHRLHRLIYASGVCAVIHFLWKVKVITWDPMKYAVILAALLAFRVWWASRPNTKVARRAAERA